jgi:CRISPR-associated protein Csb2
MLTLGIRYLCGYVTASHGRYEQVEWPPHPGRVFMALAAAHYQTGANPRERAALIWLEALSNPPVIHAAEASPRSTVTQFVPVNDRAGPAKAVMHSLPLTRDRQPRTFARAWLAEDTVFLHWPEADPTPAIRESLAQLCGKVTRIGHSSSLVQMWVAEDVPKKLSRWTPDEERATQFLRVTGEGTLAGLDLAFNGDAMKRYEELLLAEFDAPDKKAASATRKKRDAEFPHGAPESRRPRLSIFRGYSCGEDAGSTGKARQTVFSPHLLLFVLERENGPYLHLDLACTLAVTDRWREALLSHANDLSAEARSILSGHAKDGRPSEQPHCAFLPLAFLGHAHADARLSGIALALPASANGELRIQVLRALSRVTNEGLSIGRLGKWRVEPVTMARPPATLRGPTWTAHPDGAMRWSSVTPIVYDQHPKAKDKVAYMNEVATMISTGCERVGLPQPREVIVTPVSAHLGAPPAHAFPRLRRKDGSERRHTHAILVFDEPIVGPVVIGAGRYRGYGFFRPMEVA